MTSLRSILLRAALVTFGVAPVLPTRAAAQAPATIPLRLGESRTRTAAPGTPDLYHVVGVSGTALRIRVAGPGTSGITLYTPAGEEMLSAEGTDSATLEAILPLTEAFLIGVQRAGSTQPYRISVAGETPDWHFSAFAVLIGYAMFDKSSKTELATQCWVQPGVVARTIFPNGTTLESTVGRGGRTDHVVRRPDGATVRSFGLYTLDRDTVRIVYHYGAGQTRPGESFRLGQQDRYDLEYRAYRCP